MGSLQEELSGAHLAPFKTNGLLGDGEGGGEGPARGKGRPEEHKGEDGTQSRRKKGKEAASSEAGTEAPKDPAVPGVPREHKAPLLWQPRRIRAMPGDPAAPCSPRGGRTCPYPSRARARPRNSPPWPGPATGELIVVGPRAGGSAQGGRGTRAHAQTPVSSRPQPQCACADSCLE